MAIKGFFRPKNKNKYVGQNIKHIVWRSTWELKYMRYLDSSPDILQWSSEQVAIPYVSPLDTYVHRYFPDFWIKKTEGEYIIEIKPKRETRKPTTQNKRRLLKESIVYARNIAKWKAAKHYCDERGWHFRILTEDDLFRGKNL